MLDVKSVIDELLMFQTGADLPAMRRIFSSEAEAVRLWARFVEYEYDVVRWYGKLSRANRLAFAGAVALRQAQGAQGAAGYVDPTCAECGQLLTEADVAAGETTCAECGPEVEFVGLLEAVIILADGA